MGASGSVSPPATAGALWASGTSSSGAPTTTVAEAECSGGKTFADFTVFATCQGASSQFKVILTFDDDTTESFSSAVSATWRANRAGHWLGGIADLVLWTDQTKDVKKIRVETLGSGTGARTAAISGVQS